MLEGEHFAEVPPEEDPTALAGRWLITAQADFISRVENAVPVRSKRIRRWPIGVCSTAWPLTA